MTYKRLLLTKDTRGQVVEYKEFQGRKLFWKKPNPEKVYIKSFTLFDLGTKTNRKQKVMFRILEVGKLGITVEVI